MSSDSSVARAKKREELTVLRNAALADFGVMTFAEKLRRKLERCLSAAQKDLLAK